MSEKITMTDGKLTVPNNPQIPFISGDGIGPEIWAAAKEVFDAAVKKAYAGQKAVDWIPLLAGQTAFDQTGQWLPDETLETLKENLVAIKGPLTTPVGKGHRSINVTLRQKLDLYACFRPVKYYEGTPSPVKEPEKVDIAIFRENTEDIYAGIDFAEGSTGAEKLKALLEEEGQLEKVRFPKTSAFAIKPISKEGSVRLVKAAIDYALSHGRKNVALVHKGNIMKKTEGSFKQWGYDACLAYGNEVFTQPEYDEVFKTCGKEVAEQKKDEAKVFVSDVICDNFFQQTLLYPDKFDVAATMNLNGDYISDALAAQVGGIGIAPGANINYQTGRAIFEATHGTAPQFAGQDKLNPTSIILSGAMMFDYLGWTEVSELIEKAVAKAISNKHVTIDFAEKMDGATTLKTSEFGHYVAEILK